MKKFNFIALLLLMMLSCMTSYDSQMTVDHLTVSNKEYLPADDISYKSAKIVSLETNDECLMEDVREVRQYQSYLYVLDTRGDLFVFDTNGKFINKIGERGNGPDQYLKLSSFFIDKKEKNIAVIDDVKNKIFYYDLIGNFVDFDDVDPSIKYCNNAIVTKDGDILLNYYINFGLNQAYSIITGNNFKKNMYLKSYDPIEVKGYLYSFSSHPISEDINGNISFIMPLCDTIFEYSKNEFKPKYIVNTIDEMVERERFKTDISSDGNTYSSLIFQYGNKGFFTGFTGIYETEKYILLNYKYNGIVSGFYLGDKENLNGNYYISSIPEIIGKLPIVNIVGSNNEDFIGTLSAPDLIELYNKMENSFQNELLDTKEVVKTLDEESNPCLIFYSFE